MTVTCYACRFVMTFRDDVHPEEIETRIREEGCPVCGSDRFEFGDAR